jgi:hypothetical protein
VSDEDLEAFMRALLEVKRGLAALEAELLILRLTIATRIPSGH